MIKNVNNLKIAVIGLGYVGLPLSLEFAKIKNVIGYDHDKKRINELIYGLDKNLEITKKEIKKAKYIKFTNLKKDLKRQTVLL